MAKSSASATWLSLVAVLWLQLGNGASSDFPLYSSNLKQLLSISQLHLNTLAFASDAGKLLAWVSGIAVVYLPSWAVLLIGAVIGLLGYGLQFITVGEALVPTAYWQVFLLSALTGNAACWVNTVCYEVCLKNFKSKARAAIGLSSSYSGLSAAAYAIIADAFLRPSPSQKAKAILLLNTVVPAVTVVLVLPMARVVSAEEVSLSDEEFVMLFAVAMATGVIAVLGSLLGMSAWVLWAFGVLLVVNIIAPVSAKFRETAQRQRVHNADEDRGKEEEWEHGKEEKKVAPSAMMRTLEFWLYFVGYLCGATVGLVYLNNLGQIVDSRGHSKTSAVVSLAFAFSFFGRCMVSLLDFACLRNKHEVRRPALMAGLTAAMAGAFCLLLNPRNLCLYVGNAVIGTCTGAITSAAASATSELFGTKFFGINHNIVVSNIPVGSFVFGFFAAFVYQKGENERGICMGAKCYETTFLVWGCLCILSTLLLFLLDFRTRRSRFLELKTVDV
ncbi:major facilitator superfamily protein [Wolffia australiana]